VSCRSRIETYPLAKVLEKNIFDSSNNCHIGYKRQIFDWIHSSELQKMIQSTFEQALVKELCGEFLIFQVLLCSSRGIWVSER